VDEARRTDSPRLVRVDGPGRRLRVVHCIDSLASGGTELNAVRTVEQLDRDRFELALVTFAEDGPLRSRYERAGVPIHSFPVPNLYGIAAARQIGGLSRFLRAWRADVVHSHDCYNNMFATLAARLAGVPLVIASRRWHHALPRRGFAAGNRLAYRQLAHVTLANSVAVANILANEDSVPRGRIVMVPNFLEEEAFTQPTAAERGAAREALGVPADSVVIGCVANLRPEKDHAMLLEAFAALRSRHPAVHLVLIGDGPEGPALRNAANRLGIADVVHFAGHRPNRPNPHAWFDVSVLCSRHEGFPNTVIEAMAAARPVVATAVGGVPDAITDGESGVLVPPGDAERLATTLDHLLGDAPRAAQLGAVAAARVRALFHRDVVIPRLHALYARAERRIAA
jgi:glycosyltransferase involved in cell wall biosynthesis